MESQNNESTNLNANELKIMKNALKDIRLYLQEFKNELLEEIADIYKERLNEFKVMLINASKADPQSDH